MIIFNPAFNAYYIQQMVVHFFPVVMMKKFEPSIIFPLG